MQVRGSSSKSRPRRNCRRLKIRKAFGTEPQNTPPDAAPGGSATTSSGSCRCSIASPASAASKLRSAKGGRSLFRLMASGADAVAGLGLGEGVAVEVQPGDLVALDEVAGERAVPTADVEQLYPPPDVSAEPGGPFLFADGKAVTAKAGLPGVMSLVVSRRQILPHRGRASVAGDRHPVQTDVARPFESGAKPVQNRTLASPQKRPQTQNGNQPDTKPGDQTSGNQRIEPARCRLVRPAADVLGSPLAKP